MASYALPWAAIRLVRATGAAEYDLFGCAPGPDPEHPLHGLWRFKTGFGGTIVHRQGCRDYPLDARACES
jgi:lipid II:glycine glycyltransferase (peptidoglycan interpeptide bridge formation enzyme)